MKKILSGLTPTPGFHCLYSSLYNLFRYMGWPYEEHELFFLCNGMDFQFVASESIDMGEITQNLLDLIHIDYFKQIQTLADRLKQPIFWIDNRAECSVYSIRTAVEETLQDGKPVLAFLHSSILTYHILENPNENLGAHGLILYGIDSDKGIVYLADSFVTDYSNHIDTHLSTMQLTDFYNYLIGFVTFGPPLKNVPFSERLSLYVSDLQKYLQTTDVKDGGVAALVYILEEIQRANLDSTEYISLVFLLKAYLMMTAPYFDRLMEQTQRYYDSRPFNRQDQYKELQNEWNVFFMRCLSVSGQPSAKNRLVKSGWEIARKYQKYLQDCLAYLICTTEK